MKLKNLKEFVLTLALLGITPVNSTAASFGTAFTYQGRLTSGTNVSSGLYDFHFSLWDGAGSGANLIGATQTVSGVSVSNGFFTVTLDFGGGAFTGEGRWLELGVRTNSAATFGALNPRQPLTPTPYAIAASNLTGTLPAGGLSGTYGNAVTLNNPGNVFAGNGAGLTNVNASTLGGFGFCNLPCYWNLVGNAGTTPGINFLGTTDNKALEIKVNSQRAFRLEPNATSPNIVGGFAGNSALAGIFGGTIAGGGASGEPNTLEVSLSSIGGGAGNRISLDSAYSTIAGGHDNLIYTNVPGSAIGGGGFNYIFAGDYSTIAGGVSNLIGMPDSKDIPDESIFHLNNTIVGGTSNNIYHARYSTIVGGFQNSMVGDHGDEMVSSCILGGALNQMYALGNSDYGGAILGGRDNILWSGLAAITAGEQNFMGRLCWWSSIGGGLRNKIAINVEKANIGGGEANLILSGSYNSVIGGGSSNQISQLSQFSVIAGGQGNLIDTNVPGSSIDGGGFNSILAGDYSGILGGISNLIGASSTPSVDESVYHFNNTIVGGTSNQIYHARYSVIAGGLNNSMIGYHGDEPVYAAIVGGSQNQMYALGDSDYGGAIVGGLSNVLWSARATILGGQGNFMDRQCWGSAVGGGMNNAIAVNVQNASIGGGDWNQIQSTAFHSVIAGGQSNLVLHGAFLGSDFAGYATIPGGRNNTATNYAFAAGCRAKANHRGAFVWADNNEFNFPSTNANSFSVRAVGGTRFVSAINASGNPTAGVVLQPGSGSWTSLSDRDSKENLKRVNGREVLEQLDSIPIATWNYKAQDKSIRHIGPMAQDFAAAFKVGEDAHGISTVDADGVALAAIQGLHEALREKDSRIESLEKDVAVLKALVRTLVDKSAGDSK